MVRSILHQYLLKAILVALIALILHGVFPGTALAIILVIFVASRFIALATEAVLKPVSPGHKEKMVVELAGSYEKLAPEKRTARAIALKLDPRLSTRELAQAEVNRAIQARPARRKLELGAEGLGVIAFVILIPLTIALYTRDIFSFRTGQGWEGAMVAACGAALYAWPHRGLKSPGLSDVRILWWSLPFVLALPLLNHMIETRHPYLNPFEPEHHRLAAERVLSLRNNITAGQYADWVLRYARELDERGESQRAIHFYREALRLDANNRTAYARLAALETAASDRPSENTTKPLIPTSAPYWTTQKPVIPVLRRRIDKQLEGVEGCTVIVVPVGEVSDELLNAIGYVVHNELELPAYVAPDSIPLPTHTRKRGLAVGLQWDEAILFQAFTNSVKYFPKAPIKYVLITSKDLYMPDANYVFSSTYAWGAVVSSARFGEPHDDNSFWMQRTAKQTLCALLKSFNIPPSTDRDCVTSYTRSLDEFDAKGNRPNSETLRLFRQAVTELNARWQNHRVPLSSQQQ